MNGKPKKSMLTTVEIHLLKEGEDFFASCAETTLHSVQHAMFLAGIAENGWDRFSHDKKDISLIQLCMSGPDLDAGIIDGGSCYYALSNFFLQGVEDKKLIMSDIKETLVAPNTFFVLRGQGRACEIWISRQALRRNSPLRCTYRPLWHDPSFFSARYTSRLDDMELDDCVDWLTYRCSPSQRQQRLENAKTFLYRQFFAESEDKQALVAKQLEVYFIRAIAQHTWLRMYLEAYFSEDGAMLAYFRKIDQYFREANLAVCHDFDRGCFVALASVEEAKNHLINRDWQHLFSEVFDVSKTKFSTLFLGPSRYSLQKMFYKFALLRHEDTQRVCEHPSDLVPYLLSSSMLCYFAEDVCDALLVVLDARTHTGVLVPTFFAAMEVMLKDYQGRRLACLDALFADASLPSGQTVSSSSFDSDDIQRLLIRIRVYLAQALVKDQQYVRYAYFAEILAHYVVLQDRFCRCVATLADVRSWCSIHKLDYDVKAETAMLGWFSRLLRPKFRYEDCPALLEEDEALDFTYDDLDYAAKYVSPCDANVGLFHFSWFSSRHAMPSMCEDDSGWQVQPLGNDFPNEKILRTFAKRIDSEEAASSSSLKDLDLFSKALSRIMLARP